MTVDEENMSIEELRDLREREIYLQMGKLKYDDPLNDKLANRAKVISDIRCSENSTDNNRLNNNARNDVEEQKLLIEERRLRAEKWKALIEFGKITGYGILGYFCIRRSYTMSEISAPFRDMKKFGEDLIEKIYKR